MHQPVWHVDQNHPNKVCRLKKAIYGPRQSSRVWFRRLKDLLLSVGFRCSVADASLFIWSSDHVVYFLVYVDDMVVTGSDQVKVDELVERLGEIFRLKSGRT